MLDLLDGKEIYVKVERLRLKKGWTVYKLAKEAGVAPTTIYNWRDRGSSPTLSLLDAICSAYGISLLDFLLDGDELMALTEEQNELMKVWNTLKPVQKKSLLNLMKTM